MMVYALDLKVLKVRKLSPLNISGSSKKALYSLGITCEKQIQTFLAVLLIKALDL